jgi:hypothetical protein
MPWRVPKSPVDWTEILAYLVALDQLHGSTSWLDMSSGGTKSGTSWRVAVVSVFPAVSTRKSGHRLVSTVEWPNVDSADFTAAIYRLILDHDYRISREVYTQGPLPDA